MSSQLDLLPTLISLMGLEVSSPLIGRNLLNTSAPTQGRFIMQFDQLQAPPREGDQMVLLQPGAEPKTLSQSHKNGKSALPALS